MKHPCKALSTLLAAALIVTCWLGLPKPADAYDTAPQADHTVIVCPKPTTTPEVAPAVLVPAATVPQADPEDITRLAQTLWGECRGVKSKARQAAVVWCVLNRVDDPRWPDTIEEVCINSQFNGYDPSHPVDPELYDLALDVWQRWQREKAGETDVGRVLPAEYVFFHGDGRENHFRTDWEDMSTFWDWSLPDPYV